MEPSFEINLDEYTIPYKLLKFSGGELHVKLDLNNLPTKSYVSSTIVITANRYEPYFIVELALIKNALSKEFNTQLLIEQLKMSYIPYARQDRVCSEGDAFSLEVFAKQLNALQFDAVFVTDPHSDVAPALINNCIIISTLDLFIANNVTTQYSHLVAPDAGAYKKVQKISEYFEKEVIPCLKTRDVSTGRLSNTIVVTDGLVEPITRMLVVDDICDKGGTFILLGKKLKELYPNIEIDLYVTHGIFAAGTTELYKYYNNIMCHNNFNIENTYGVKVIG